MSNPYDSPNTKNSVLGSTLKFKGELSADEDLLIQGHIEGTIKHSSNLTIGTEGKLDANVDAQQLTVEGRVKGDLRASGSIVVKESANIDGNIVSPTVSLFEGATFNGSIAMKDPAEVPAKPRETKEPAQAEAVAESKPKATSSDESEPAPKRRSNRKSASAA